MAALSRSFAGKSFRHRLRLTTLIIFGTVVFQIFHVTMENFRRIRIAIFLQCCNFVEVTNEFTISLVFYRFQQRLMTVTSLLKHFVSILFQYSLFGFRKVDFRVSNTASFNGMRSNPATPNPTCTHSGTVGTGVCMACVTMTRISAFPMTMNRNTLSMTVFANNSVFSGS